MRKDLKFVQGSVREGEVATIRFMDEVDAWTVSSFIDEFQWLENWIKPSKIRVLINSEGGSVIRGMSAFSTIISSSIKTECVVEGLAASMASVLLAAGDVVKMRDYGIIMIHNPFYSNDPSDSDSSDITAFKNQLKTIYKERWGIDEETIKSIMDGKEGEDGTFMNAEQAVELGIVSEENVIKTTKQAKAMIKASLNDSPSIKDRLNVFAKISGDNQIEPNEPIINQKKNTNQNEEKMNEQLQSIAATLSMDKNSTQAEIIAKVAELSGLQNKLDDLQAANGKLAAEKAGLEASVSNLTSENQAKEDKLVTLTAELTEFKNEKAEQAAAEREALVDAAIEAGKIQAEAKEQWLAMANSNFEACKTAIEGIVGRTKISASIADNASTENHDQPLEGDKDLQKIQSVVGEDFKFQTI